MSRLDRAAVDRGIAKSRERAKEYIAEGRVFVNGKAVTKPSAEVSDSDEITLSGEEMRYVGRGGLKLEKALSEFKIDVSGLTCLDIGASTGGFTDCLLQNGAKKVYAADVGHGQLAEKLRADDRVVCSEGVNVKDFTAETFPEPIDFICADLSFISARFAADAAALLLREGCSAVILIKPQFDAGRKNIGKNGVVKDPKAHAEVIESLVGYFNSIGLTVCGLAVSPIKGGDGNTEYLAHLKKQENIAEFAIDFKKFCLSALKG